MTSKNDKKPPVIFIMGPTASGKTDLAIALSKHYPIDVISVDSALIYRDMNIGTAKPTADELACTPHVIHRNRILRQIFVVMRSKRFKKAMPQIVSLCW